MARENLGLCPASPNSDHVEGERTFVDRCWIPCYKNPTYVAGTGTAGRLEVAADRCRGRGGGGTQNAMTIKNKTNRTDFVKF